MAVQLLQDIYLFKDLLPKELDQLSELGTVKSYQPEDEIFREGEEAKALYVIRHGTVSIRRVGKDKDLDVAQLAGDLFDHLPVERQQLHARLADRLATRFGPERVLQAQVQADHRLECAGASVRDGDGFRDRVIKWCAREIEHVSFSQGIHS